MINVLAETNSYQIHSVMILPESFVSQMKTIKSAQRFSRLFLSRCNRDLQLLDEKGLKKLTECNINIDFISRHLNLRIHQLRFKKIFLGTNGLMFENICF